MHSPVRPKLMYVLGMSPQKIGGMEKFLRYFVRAMDVRGWDTVLCFEEPIADRCRDYLALPSVTIEALSSQHNLGTACALRLNQLLALHSPQVFVYAFDGVMRVFPWIAKAKGVRHIFFNDHSSRPMGVAVTPMSLPKRAVGRFLTAPLTGIISVCEFVKRSAAITGLASAPNTVVWNGVEVGEPQVDRGHAFRRQYGIPPDALVLTMSVWMVVVKGVDVLMRAAAGLMLDNPKIWLLLVGDGPMIEPYRQLAAELTISDRTVFTGLVSDPVGIGVFDATDISCQPSLWQEANPLAVLEAMSMRLPVIASDIGGMPEIVKDKETGLLFPPGDWNAMREKLAQLAGDPSTRTAMGEAGRRRVMEHHRIDDVASRYCDILTN